MPWSALWRGGFSDPIACHPSLHLRTHKVHVKNRSSPHSSANPISQTKIILNANSAAQQAPDRRSHRLHLQQQHRARKQLEPSLHSRGTREAVPPNGLRVLTHTGTGGLVTDYRYRQGNASGLRGGGGSRQVHAQQRRPRQPPSELLHAAPCLLFAGRRLPVASSSPLELDRTGAAD